MPNILTVSNQEIVWQLGGYKINAGEHANSRLEFYLGEDARHFARMITVSKGYTWVSPETGWAPLATASAAQEHAIKDKIEEVRLSVRQRLSSNPQLADKILSFPNDLGKYVFFKDSGEDLRILIAGWGFSNSRRKYVIPDPVPITVPMVTESVIGFTIDGELQPGHNFTILTKSGTQKPCSTDADGLYRLGQQKVDTKIEIRDSYSGKQFTFSIEQGKEQYIYDVTQYLNLRVSALEDDKPLTDTLVSVLYHSKTYSLTTSGDGLASLSLPYFPGEMIEAKCKGQSQCVMAEMLEVDLSFAFATPVVPPPPVILKSVLTIQCVDQDGIPVSDYPLSVIVDNDKKEVLTNADGRIFTAELPEGTLVEVRDGFSNVEPMSHLITAGENLLVYQIYREHKLIRNSLQMIASTGLPYANKKVVLRQGEKSEILTLDESGTAEFDARAFEPDVRLTAQIIEPNAQHDPIPFTLEADEHEYLIVELTRVEKAWWHVLVNIILALAIILAVAWLGDFFISYLFFWSI